MKKRSVNPFCLSVKRSVKSLSLAVLSLGVMVSAAPVLAQEVLPQDLTREADQALAKKDTGSAKNLFTQALGRYANHPLRPYWVYQLAKLNHPVTLQNGDPLLPHYHWWRAINQPKNVCSDGFAQYGRLSPLSEVLPSVPESTEIQDRLHCVEKLPERERVAVARVLDQHRYFWLMPRLLKTVSSPDGLWLQAESRLLNRDYRGALASYQTLLKQQTADGNLKKRALIQAGVAERRLRNPRGAEKIWASISTQDSEFYPEVLWQRAQMAYGSESPVTGNKLLQDLIKRFPSHARAPEALENLLRQAIEAQSPATIQTLGRQIVAGWPEHEVANTARYWLARTLEKQGKRTEALQLFEHQAVTGPINNYYTQLAKCRVANVDCFTPRYVALTAREPQLDFMRQLPFLQELIENRQSGIVEVIAPFVSLSALERDLLKSWALRHNGHYFRSIRTIWTQPTRDTEMLRLMYPMHFDALQKENAKRFNLPQSLIAGLTWQESMYKADIKSPAGATGLMQLMPATARGIAGKAGVSGFNVNQLTDPKVNIRLGSYYLREQLNTWQGNLMPVIAAYNAGPGAASRWLKSFGHLDKDAFVERIPYEETRRYVKMVTTHMRVYETVYGD